MPRYAYSCGSCAEEFLTMHTAAETLDVCNICNISGSLTKLLTVPSYTIKQGEPDKVGRVTEDFIKESRQELRKQKEELLKN